MNSTQHYEVLIATRAAACDGSDTEPDLAELDHAPAPWETNLQATCECLSWRGALDNLARRHAEDELGTTLYRDFPVHARSVLVTAHSLMDAGAISAEELEARMTAVRARFERR
jgi:hypothetical protein